MKASYTWLQSYFADPLPEPEVLAALLTEHVFEVEEVLKVNDDTVFDFKVLPDRAHYLLSHRGLAREIAVLLERTTQEPTYHVISEGGSEEVKVHIQNEAFCERWQVRRFSKVAITATPQELGDRLENTGQRTINPLVDISNYVMFDMGQPSHMLDADNVVGDLVIRNAQPGETIVILGGKEITLEPTDVVIADDNGPLEIAGVKGGERAAVSEKTRNIIVHAGKYDPSQVRITATRLNLRSDASKRFENEITAAFAEEGMRALSAHIMQLAPDAIASPVNDVYLRPYDIQPIQVDPMLIEQILGTRVDAHEISAIMQRMGCRITTDGALLAITPPPERFDLRIPEDIADEVGRVKGYNALVAKMPAVRKTPQQQDPLFWYSEYIKNILIDRGYSEALLYAFTDKGDREVIKPLASDKAFLRTNLSELLHLKLGMNATNMDLLECDRIKMCELGKVFKKEHEEQHLAIGGVINRKKKKDIVAEIDADIAAVQNELSILWNAPANFLENVEVHDNQETENGTYVRTFNLSALFTMLPEPGQLHALRFTSLPKEKKYMRIIPYPFITRDIAVFVSEETPVMDVLEKIRAEAGPLLVRSRLFDEFLKEGRRSYAFRLVFQSPERTLEDSEIMPIMAQVETSLKERGWEVR